MIEDIYAELETSRSPAMGGVSCVSSLCLQKLLFFHFFLVKLGLALVPGEPKPMKPFCIGMIRNIKAI